MLHHTRVLASFAMLAGLSCLNVSHSIAPLPPGGHHVLFIGNSLTYVNDLPATVAAIARDKWAASPYTCAPPPSAMRIRAGRRRSWRARTVTMRGSSSKDQHREDLPRFPHSLDEFVRPAHSQSGSKARCS